MYCNQDQNIMTVILMHEFNTLQTTMVSIYFHDADQTKRKSDN